MQSINFDEGIKTFSINGDEARVIRINPGDLNLLIRSEEAQKHIAEYQEQIKRIPLNPDGTPVDGSEESSDALRSFNSMMRKELNYIFNADVYDTVFAGQSPLCTVGKEKMFLFEAFMLSMMSIIKNEIAEFNTASQARVKKYTGGYSK